MRITLPVSSFAAAQELADLLKSQGYQITICSPRAHQWEIIIEGWSVK